MTIMKLSTKVRSIIKKEEFLMKMKKWIALVLAAVLALGLVACSAGGGSKTPTSTEGEISVFYYTFSDTYISSVRTAVEKLLEGKNYNSYDGNGNQTTQTEQVTTAIAKGSKMLIVNVVDTGSNDAAQNIVDQAKAANIPVIFFNRSVDESVINSYDKCAFIGTDYEMAGHMQGEMIGQYILDNYDAVDLNGDGKISYVMFKGQEGNMEAIARTQYGVEDCNKVLTAAGKPEIVFYDPENTKGYLVDQNGLWSSAAATDYMNTVLAKHSEANNNMVELVIANNDDMALGAISALQAAGYNNGTGTTIPVFGVDATDAAKEAIANKQMVGTIKQDAEGMANTIVTMANNFTEGKDKFDGIATENVVGTWRVNIPYGTYTGE